MTTGTPLVHLHSPVFTRPALAFARIHAACRCQYHGQYHAQAKFSWVHRTQAIKQNSRYYSQLEKALQAPRLKSTIFAWHLVVVILVIVNHFIAVRRGAAKPEASPRSINLLLYLVH